MAKILLTKNNSSWGVITNPQSANEFRHTVAFKDISKRDEFIALDLFGDVNYEWKTELENKTSFEFIPTTALETTLTIIRDEYENETIASLLNKDFAILKDDNDVYYFYALSGGVYDSQGTITYSAVLDVPFTYNILFNLKNDVIVKQTHVNDEVIHYTREEVGEVKKYNLKRYPQYKFLYIQQKLVEGDEEGLIITNENSGTTTTTEGPNEVIQFNGSLPIVNAYTLTLDYGFISDYKNMEVIFSYVYNNYSNSNQVVNISNPQINETYYLKDLNSRGTFGFKIISENQIQFFTNYDNDGITTATLNTITSKDFKNSTTNNSALTAPFSLKLIPISESDTYYFNGVAKNFNTAFDNFDDGNIINARILEYNPLNTVTITENNGELYFSENGTQTNVVLNDAGYIDVLKINVNEIDAINQIEIDLTDFNEDKKLIYSGIKSIKLGYFNSDDNITLPIDLVNNSKITLQKRLEVFSDLKMDIDILNYSNDEIGIKDIYYDFPYNIDNWEAYKLQNQGTLLNKRIASGALTGAGLLSGIFNPLLGGALIFGGASSSLLFSTERRNLNNTPKEVSLSNSKLMINLIEQRQFLAVWNEKPRDNYDNIISNKYKLFGNVVNILTNDVNDLIVNDRYQYFIINETFENINLNLSAETKQLINDIFEQGITFWFYENAEKWGGVKNYD